MLKGLKIDVTVTKEDEIVIQDSDSTVNLQYASPVEEEVL